MKVIENIFDYQRSVSICKKLLIFVSLILPPIETAIKRYQLDSDEFIQRVKEGDVSYEDCEKLEFFEKILPRLLEVQRLKEAIINEGVSTFEEAVKVLKFGTVENFMIKTLINEKLDLKVQLLIKILK